MIYIKWKPPSNEYVKLNIHASRNYTTSLCTMESVIRDEVGQWIFGYGKKLGSISILEAEL